MAAKELILIAKDKYRAMMETRDKETGPSLPHPNSYTSENDDSNTSSSKTVSANTAAATTTTARSSTIRNDNDITRDKDVVKPVDSENKMGSVVRVVRSSSDRIPGMVERKNKTERRKTIKWLSY